MRVETIQLRLIFNSAAEPTIEAVLNGKFIASSAGGTSVSAFEEKVVEPRKAINNFEQVKKEFIGDFTQESFDAILKKHSKLLGSVLTTSLSLAFFEMCFHTQKKTRFPNILGNVIGGGEHSYNRGPEIQEILAIPKAKTMTEAVETNMLIWKEVKEALKKINALYGLNAESAWITNLENKKALNLASKIVEKHNARLGIDFAASSIFRNGFYYYKKKRLSREKHLDYVEKICKDFDLAYIEDPLDENDFGGFAEIQNRLKKTIICGDDLISSNPERLKMALWSIKAVIVKPNQIGNVSDCLEIMKLSKENGISSVVSHRSKETCCSTIAKLALEADFAKFGVAGIRTAKLNELIRLWERSEKPYMSDF